MGKIIRRSLTVLLALVIALIIARALISSYKGEFKDLTATDNLKSFYAENGTFPVRTHRVETLISTNRQFSAYALRYVPDAGELQITLRHNDGAYRYTGAETGTTFGYSLRNSATEELIPGTVNGQKRWLMYTFVTVSFEGVSFDEAKDDISVLAFEGGEAFDEILIHHHSEEFGNRSLTKAEIADLEN